MVVSQKLVQEINGCIRNKALVLRGNKFAPWLARISAENLVVLNIQLQVVLLQVSKQLVSAQNAGNLDKLVVVVVSVEERLLAEDLSYEFNTMNSRINLRLIANVSSSATHPTECVPHNQKKKKKSIPCWQTWRPSSTCRGSSRIPGNQQATRGPWSSEMRHEHCTLFQGGRILQDPSRSNAAVDEDAKDGSQ